MLSPWVLFTTCAAISFLISYSFSRWYIGRERRRLEAKRVKWDEEYFQHLIKRLDEEFPDREEKQ